MHQSILEVSADLVEKHGESVEKELQQEKKRGLLFLLGTDKKLKILISVPFFVIHSRKH
jgi:hypothetical protein